MFKTPLIIFLLESYKFSFLLLFVDPPKGQEWVPDDHCFNYATDFVRYVRDTQGETFTIAVAGLMNI